MQLILSIYHVICSVTSKINIKNSAKFNIRSTSRLTYDIISQLHLPQNGYFMERSNFLVAIIKLILRSLAIIPGWFVSLGHEIVTFLFILIMFIKANVCLITNVSGPVLLSELKWSSDSYL